MKRQIRIRTTWRGRLTWQEIEKLTGPSRSATPGTRAYEYLSGKLNRELLRLDPRLRVIIPKDNTIQDAGHPGDHFIFDDGSYVIYKPAYLIKIRYPSNPRGNKPIDYSPLFAVSSLYLTVRVIVRKRLPKSYNTNQQPTVSWPHFCWR